MSSERTLALALGAALLAASVAAAEGGNELLITDLRTSGSITIFEHEGGGYRELWSTVTPGIETYGGGGEVGDLTGDGIAEIVLVARTSLQIWTYDSGVRGWVLLWSRDNPNWPSWSVGDILDVDNDGQNELLVTNDYWARLELYSYGESGFALEATVRVCTSGARFIATAGDLDGDGTPEILFQCVYGEDLVIQEHAAGSYPIVGRVSLPPGLPPHLGSLSLFVDDMETGDVNGDGRADAVFCGNSGRAHVVTFDARTRRYLLEYSSPRPSSNNAFSQTCSVGDLTHDGVADILVITQEGAKVYSHEGAAYREIWTGAAEFTPIGGSFIGDADNDGFNEILFGNAIDDAVAIYENDIAGAAAFVRTVSFRPLTFGGGSIIVGDMKPEGTEEPGDPDRGDPDPLPLPSPTDLAAVVRPPNDVLLTWKDNAIAEDSYRVEQRSGSGAFTEIAVLPAGSTQSVISALTPGQRFVFRVRAAKGGDFSAYSNRVAVVLPDVPPSTPVPIPNPRGAEPVSPTEVRLRWEGVGADAVVHADLRSPAQDYAEVATARGDAGEVVVTGLLPDTPYTFRLRSVGPGGSSAYSAEVHATTLGTVGACRRDGTHLCLLDGRFEVGARWKIPRAPFDDGAGAAVEVPGSDQTGMFWFFHGGNFELIVKMLDGSAVNGFAWHFYGALTDVEYWTTVRDTLAGGVRTYHNPPGTLCGGADTESFALPVSLAAARPPQSRAGAVPATITAVESTGSCAPSETTLCLGEGRFEIAVDWSNPRREGDSGIGRVATAAATDQTGFFWFFDPANVDLAVKMLDGRPLNGRFWFFWGALSDVEYTIRVRDTVGGTTEYFHNGPYTLCGGADLEAF